MEIANWQETPIRKNLLNWIVTCGQASCLIHSVLVINKQMRKILKNAFWLIFWFNFTWQTYQNLYFTKDKVWLKGNSYKIDLSTVTCMSLNLRCVLSVWQSANDMMWVRIISFYTAKVWKVQKHCLSVAAYPLRRRVYGRFPAEYEHSTCKSDNIW